MVDRLSSEQRSKLMASVRQKGTAPELLVCEELKKRRVSFETHPHGLPGTPDIVLRKQKVAVFIHGCFWHGHECRAGRMSASNINYWRPKIATNRRRDKRKATALRRDGWRVATIWTCRLKTSGKVKAQVDRVLRLRDLPRVASKLIRAVAP